MTTHPLERSQEIPARCPLSKAESMAKRVIAYIRHKIKGKYGHTRPQRAFHAKTIGLVEGDLFVESELDRTLKVGLFKEPAKYKVWVRFTNGASDLHSIDSGKMARGMAIKVMDANRLGTNDIHSRSNSQDIILLSSPMFAPPVSKFQMAAMRVALGNILERVIWGLGLITLFPSGSTRFIKLARRQTPNVLEEMYWSCSPYAFGQGKAIKWHVRPLKTISSVMPERPHPNFLRDRLIRDLSKNAKDEVAFELFVQFQENEKTEPIDNTHVIWKTKFHKVATISIPRQNIASKERSELDLQITFSPGNALADHAPLGSVNELRKKVYETLAKERLEHKVVTQT